MKTFKQFINEAGGQGAGTHELVKTDLKTARAFGEKSMSDRSKELDIEIPDFDKNYPAIQKTAALGTTKRKDMPVIDGPDVKNLQKALKFGFFDIKAPFADKKGNDPFPKGLSGADAKKFLIAGLAKNDGAEHDDTVNVKLSTIEVSKLKPIQKQIFFDKAIIPIAENGATNSAKFFQSKATTFIVSADNFIIDGHHRYLAANLIDPKMKVNTLVISLPINELLPLTLSFSDAIGNKRNK